MKLYFVNGPKKGESFELAPPFVTLGRETDNSVSLLVAGVSRYHARIDFKDEKWFIRDLGSTNGSKVNGNKIADAHELKAGDFVSIGDQELKITGDAPEAEGKAPIPLDEMISTRTDAVIKMPEPIPQSGDNDVTAIFNRPPDSTVSPSTRTVQDIEDQKTMMDNIAVPPPAASEETPKPEGDSGTASPNYENSMSKLNFFGGNSNEESEGATPEGKKKRRHAGFIFYVSVICLGVIFVALFIIFEKEKARKRLQGASAKVEKEKPYFLLVYSKRIVSPDNIFYFSLQLEDGQAKFVVDDIKANLHYSKFVEKISPESLNELKRTIKDTSFMTLPQDKAARKVRAANRRSILIGMDKDLNEITVEDNYASSSFETIEVAVDDFAAEHGLKTISLTPEELKDEAEKAFYKAEDLFENFEAKPENLREAINRYQITLDFLNKFSPKPAIWNTARKKQQEAKAILDKTIKDLDFDSRQAIRLKQMEKALELSTIMLNTADPESKIYQKYKKAKLSIETVLRKKKRK